MPETIALLNKMAQDLDKALAAYNGGWLILPRVERQNENTNKTDK